ncbi:hypothetical protein [Symbiopectobacterium sp. RP]|uniref:hypothetical protein n=1 Tax=Symbiopectobacterium sp. RP TaxID=3248553 RepID=UPI003D2BF157
MAVLALRITLVLSRRWQASPIWAIVFAVLVGSSVLWPSTRGWTAYLALAFQTPSLISLVWGLNSAWYAWQTRTKIGCAVSKPRVDFPLALCGVLLGWALWLDTLNLWPAIFDIPLFDLGFSNYTLWVVCALVALLGGLAHCCTVWAQKRHQEDRTIERHALTNRHMLVYNWIALALLLFAITRWPSGNVWDAVLDIWVWIGCHVVLIRRLKLRQALRKV